MNNKIKKLQIQKVIQEYNLLNTDYELKNNMVEEYRQEFLKETFSEEKPREHIYDAGTCNEYMRQRRLSLLGKHVFGGNCGLCVQSCHFGKPRLKENESRAALSF